MSLTSNSMRDIEIYIAEQLSAPVYFPQFTIATKPAGGRWRFKGIYVLDTSKPAWMDINGVWRYADASLV